MTTLEIVRRDLLRYARNPLRTALLFAIPLVLAGMFALAFGGGAAEQVSIRVLLWDEDGTFATRMLERLGDSHRAAGRLDVIPVGPDGLERMERGEASALLHIPAGFTAAVLDGEPTHLELVKNPAERFLPVVVDEGVHLGATLLSEGASLLRDELEMLRHATGDGTAPDDATIAAMSVAINRKMREAGPVLLPPVVTLDSGVVSDDETAAPSSSQTTEVLAVVLPGLSVMGILFLAQSATRDVLRDRETGLLRHLMTGPVTSADYLAGKCLAVVLASALGLGVLVLVGIAAGVRWGPPAGVVAMVVATSVAAAGVLLLLMSLCRTERQGDTVTTIVILVSSMLGGVFVPLSQLPDVLLPAARATPVYWAVDGFRRLMADGATAAAPAFNLGVLVAIGGLTLAAGVWILGRRLTGVTS